MNSLPHDLILRDRQSHRLFHIHILPRPHRSQGCQDMPVIGRGDQHRIHVIASHQLPEVMVSSAVTIPVMTVDEVPSRFEDVRFEITERDHLRVRSPQEIQQHLRDRSNRRSAKAPIGEQYPGIDIMDPERAWG